MKANFIFKDVAKRMATRLTEKATCFKQAHKLVIRHHAARNAIAADIASTSKAAHSNDTATVVNVDIIADPDSPVNVSSTDNAADHAKVASTASADRSVKAASSASVSSTINAVNSARSTNAARPAEATSTTNATSPGRSAEAAHPAFPTRAAFRKEKACLAKDYAAAVKQRNKDVLAANVAASRVIAAHYGNKTGTRPASKSTRAARKLNARNQQAIQANQKTLSLQDQLNKLNKANRLAEIKVDDTNSNIRFFHKECEEKPQRIENLSQKLHGFLIAREHARDERDRLSQVFYKLSL
ncbi:hypothetical protein IWW40_005152 [Coemansia sp. RSA 1250]|nr:hypothetical protein IWW40_005152 [Coemansia sp. RSA 1250]